MRFIIFRTVMLIALVWMKDYYSADMQTAAF